LDFGAILAVTKAKSPSVIQIHTQDVTPNALKEVVFAAISQYQQLLQSGALIVVNQRKLRARILPLQT
jgi:predicted nuclease of predicted toxin-antitoxin system